MTLLLNAVVFLHENGHCITFFSKSSVDIQFCMIYQYFLNHRLCNLYWLLHVLFSFYFGYLSHNHFFCHEISRYSQVWQVVLAINVSHCLTESECITVLPDYPDSANRLVGFSYSQEISNLLGKRLQGKLESHCWVNVLHKVALVCRLVRLII